MVFTRKFSEFPAGGVLAAPDMPVGLESGVNTRWDFQGGGGGSGGTSVVLPQPTPPVTNGSWVRVTPGSGIYTPGQADTAEDAEIIGLVVAADLATFTLQQSGYVPASMGVPTITGLTPGTVYFLDTVTLGTMVPTDAIITGTISRPVFVADSTDSGWIVPYRPLVVSGEPVIPSPGPSPGTDTSIVTINQTAHGFMPGDVLKVATPASAGAITYAKAQADILANAQVVGVVVANPAPSTNQFTLQFSGYNTGAISTDDMGNPVIASVVYYLSSTVPGRLTANNPVLAISKPVYIPEQGTANLGVNAGYIFPQRPLGPTDSNNSIHTVFANNTFNPGQWVYIQTNNTYQLANATSLTTAQVAGVVTSASATQFTVQQSGWNSGTVSTTYVDGGTITPGAVYYLSINPGNISISPPVLVGQVTKPCYVQEQSGTLTGQILPQRPLVIVSPSGGGGGYSLLGTFDVTNLTELNLPTLFIGYQDIRIIGENLTFIQTQAPFNLTSSFALGLQVYTGGVLRSTNFYGNTTNRGPAITITSGFISSVADARSLATLAFDYDYYGVNSSISTKIMSGRWWLFQYASTPFIASDREFMVGNPVSSYYCGDVMPIQGVRISTSPVSPTCKWTGGTIKFLGVPI